MAILQCKQDGLTYNLGILHTFEGAVFSSNFEKYAPTILWCPLQPLDEMLLVEQGRFLSLASPDGRTLWDAGATHVCLFDMPSFSPCGTLCSVRSTRLTELQDVLDSRSGAVYRLPLPCGEHTSLYSNRPHWPASGSCIVVQTVRDRHGSDTHSCVESLCPFSLLRY